MNTVMEPEVFVFQVLYLFNKNDFENLGIKLVYNDMRLFLHVRFPIWNDYY